MSLLISAAPQNKHEAETGPDNSIITKTMLKMKAMRSPIVYKNTATLLKSTSRECQSPVDCLYSMF